MNADPLTTVTRFEIHDHRGENGHPLNITGVGVIPIDDIIKPNMPFVVNGVSIVLSLEDDDQTLKVHVRRHPTMSRDMVLALRYAGLATWCKELTGGKLPWTFEQWRAQCPET